MFEQQNALLALNYALHSSNVLRSSGACYDYTPIYTLTDALVAAVKQLGERRSGALVLDHLGALLLGGELAQHAGSHVLDVLNGRVQQLHEQRDRAQTPATHETPPLVACLRAHYDIESVP